MTERCIRCHHEVNVNDLSLFEIREWDREVNYERRATTFVVCKECSREFRQKVYDYCNEVAYGWCAGIVEESRGE